jgi:hypothetical protein
MVSGLRPDGLTPLGRKVGCILAGPCSEPGESATVLIPFGRSPSAFPENRQFQTSYFVSEGWDLNK